MVTELDALFDRIKNLNEVDYLVLFNQYYVTAFLLAKAYFQTQAALDALQSINLTPVIGYPCKQQLSAGLPHDVLEYAITLEKKKDEYAKVMHQEAQKLFKQAGHGEDYFRVLFNQKKLDSKQLNNQQG